MPTMKLSKKFTKVLALSLFVICPIIAFYLGVYYQNSKQAETVITSTITQTPPTTYNDSLVVEDWRIVIPLTDSLTSLQVESVEKSSYSPTDEVVTLYAPELYTQWICSSRKGNIGSIVRTSDAKRAGPYEPLATKKIDGYTYSFEGSLTSNCTKDPLHEKLVTEFIKAFASLEKY